MLEKDVLFRAIIDALPHAVLVLEERKIMYANYAAERLFGWGREELFGESTRLLYRSEVEYEEIGKRVYSKCEEGSHEVIYPCKDKNGKDVICSISVALIGDTDGKEKAVVVYEDITERIEAEKEVQESEEQYRELIENAHELIAGISLDGMFVHTSKSWRETFGYDERAFSQMSVFDVIAGESKNDFEEYFKEAIANVPLTNKEIRFKTKDGKTIFAEGNLIPRTFYGKVVAVWGFFRDVTENRRIYAELRDLNEHLEQKVKEQTGEIRCAYEVEKKARHDLEELDKAKTDFILTTQHHLRTPLTVIKGVISMALGQSETLPEQVVTYLEKADTNVERLGSLINDFLEISQMEIGRTLLHMEPATLYNILPDVLTEVRDEMDRKNVALKEFFTSEARNFEYMFDKKKMHEALLNIVDNAVKYTPPGGTITINCMLTVHPIEKTRVCRLTISDSGIGMTEEELMHAFSRSFERGEKAKTLNVTGRGLGLVLTKQVVNAHGGTVHAESDGYEKGTSLIIEFPIVNKKEKEDEHTS